MKILSVNKFDNFFQLIAEVLVFTKYRLEKEDIKMEQYIRKLQNYNIVIRKLKSLKIFKNIVFIRKNADRTE